MRITNHLRKLAASAAATAGAIAVAGAVASASLVMPASAAPAAPADGALAAAPRAASNFPYGSGAVPLTRTVTLHLGLTPMPQGQLVLGTSGVDLTGYGFTPGSSHEVALSFLGLQVPVGTLAANATGSATWKASLSTVASALASHGGWMNTPGDSAANVQLIILNAGQGTPAIARTPALTGPGQYQVHGVEPGRGVIKPGSATIVYNQGTATISVTVNATGLTPGAHAAHIHVGSCQHQGGIAYTLTDFTADSHGVISNETRTVTGVTAARLSGGWYLNLHQGNGNDILSNGQPTVNFRPLLCANI